MIIRELRLFHFRNYEKATLTPSEGVTVLHGENAQGKTNLIEAIHLCALGRSHRTGRDLEMIRFAQGMARVTVSAGRKDGIHEVQVSLSRQEGRRKAIQVNGSPIGRMGELMGHVNAVLFSPEDLRLVKEGPEGRRRFLDMEISQLSPGYFYALQRYQRALAQRNGLLKSLQGEKNPALFSTLTEWDHLLAAAGSELITRRKSHVAALQAATAAKHAMLTAEKETLALAYVCQGETEEELLGLLRAAHREDVRRGSTSIGPHRDDLRITLCGHEARIYASQGQQRTIALSLKLAEIQVMEDVLGESPVLLLDDVMSELDISRRRMLLAHMGAVQTLITCTHPGDLGGAGYDAAYRIEKGTIIKA